MSANFSVLSTVRTARVVSACLCLTALASCGIDGSGVEDSAIDVVEDGGFAATDAVLPNDAGQPDAAAVEDGLGDVGALDADVADTAMLCPG